MIGSSLAFQIWPRCPGGSVPGRHATRCASDMGVDGRGRRARGRPPAAAATPTTPCSRSHPGSRSSRSPTASAQLPGTTATRSSQLAQSGTIRSKYQPAEQTSLEGLTWPDTYFVEGQTDDGDPADDRVRVRRARRRRRPRQHCGDGAHARSRPWSSRRWSRPRRGSPRTRPLIAAVIANRLQQGCRSRSTRRSATRRAAARRCRPTPTSRSTRRTTRTGSAACRPRRS